MASVMVRNRTVVDLLDQPIETEAAPWKAVRQYAVLGRRAGDISWDFVGALLAPNDHIANVYARAAFDEERWAELAVSSPGHLIPMKFG